MPLSAARANGTPEWQPVMPIDAAQLEATMSSISSRMGSLSITSSAAFEGGPASPTAADAAGGGGAAAVAAADAVLRAALQRLFTPTGPAAGRQPTWLYINHLGWCRG